LLPQLLQIDLKGVDMSSSPFRFRLARTLADLLQISPPSAQRPSSHAGGLTPTRGIDGLATLPVLTDVVTLPSANRADHAQRRRGSPPRVVA
jgi:hypothetical protein